MATQNDSRTHGFAPQTFKHATLYFSRGTPNLAKVIPVMDKLDETLSTASLNSAKYHSAIREAAAVGKKLLNSYYSRTDQSKVYRIGIGE